MHWSSKWNLSPEIRRFSTYYKNYRRAVWSYRILKARSSFRQWIDSIVFSMDSEMSILMLLILKQNDDTKKHKQMSKFTYSFCHWCEMFGGVLSAYLEHILSIMLWLIRYRFGNIYVIEPGKLIISNDVVILSKHLQNANFMSQSVVQSVCFLQTNDIVSDIIWRWVHHNLHT